MKRYLNSVILFLCFISSGCTADSILNELPDSETKLKLMTIINNTKNNSLPNIQPLGNNRSIGAIVGENLPLNSSIGIYVSLSADSYIPYKPENSANICWEQSVNGWIPKNTNGSYSPFHLTENTPYLYTYYPYSDKASVSAPILDIKPGYTDYMYGKEINTPTYSDKKILLSHAMSTLSFTFTNQGYDGDCELEAITINNIPCNGLMNLTDGKILADQTFNNLHIASYEDAKGYTPSIPDGSAGFTDSYNFKEQTIGSIDFNSSSYEKRLGMFHIMVFPTNSVSDQTKLNVTIDGEVKSVSFTSSSRILKWDAGKRYIYNVILKQDESIEVYLEGYISNYIREGLITESIGKKHYVINESGLDRLNRPTSPNSKSYSRAFQVAKEDINDLSWFTASGWKSLGNQQFTGCHSYNENSFNDWRIPTQKELEFIIDEINSGKSRIKPLDGKYWSNYTSFIFNWVSSPFNVKSNTGKYTYNWDPAVSTSQKLKVRCIRDLIK